MEKEIKYHDTEEAQMAYCKSIGCFFECEWCVGYSESMPKLVPYKKAKIIKTKNKWDKLEWDKLAQGVTHKPTDPDEHPLLQEVLRLFTTRGGNK